MKTHHQATSYDAFLRLVRGRGWSRAELAGRAGPPADLLAAMGRFGAARWQAYAARYLAEETAGAYAADLVPGDVILDQDGLKLRVLEVRTARKRLWVTVEYAEAADRLGRPAPATFRLDAKARVRRAEARLYPAARRAEA